VPRKLPPYTELFRDRHGKLRVYFRRNKQRVPLPASIGSAEFEEAYSAALAGHVEARKEQRPQAQSGSIEALIVAYLKSAAYLDLRTTSQQTYRNLIETLRTEHGHRTLRGMTRQGIETKILAPYLDRPGQRLAILKLLRVLIRHAIALGWLKHDPSLGIKRLRSGEIRSWTEAEIAQFEARWPIGTKQRLAFALMLYTGQRRSDVHRMTWTDIDGDSIRVVQQKTGAKLTIRLHSELRAVLAEAKRGHVTILNTEYGRPFTVDGFYHAERDHRCRAAARLSASRPAQGRRTPPG
jgi:integrase